MAWGVFTNEQKPFERPAQGWHPALLVDAYPYTNSAGKNKIKFVWLVNEKDSEGRYKRVFQNCNEPKQANDASGLYKIVQAILGVPPAQPINVPALIGVQRYINIVYAPNPAKPNDPWVNIIGITPLQPGLTVHPTAADYQRKEKSQGFTPPTQAAHQQQVAQFQQPVATQSAQAYTPNVPTATPTASPVAVIGGTAIPAAAPVGNKEIPW